MKTSWIETSQIENWLQQKGDVSERLVTEVKSMLSPQLSDKIHWQSKTYELVHLYGREKLREEIKTLEQELFTTAKHHSFQARIRSIFKR
ncbi:hypothetical protein N6H18_05230 [Reichenbachiella agarivorans]|uniref:Uncharacterized protein n=1 Tax=Reichenbachiella agarivorans TaxID=2979464 RepID=A0ABY6CV74_9BACT|nr:hypothetical protein [Reichenbachiella agarivorans]UXP33353.1 hypothetical protein N6H18_05230 [Reichenbachiella agarivorans]